MPFHPLVEYLFVLLQHSATVIDGMAIVQVNGNKKTLRAISNAVLAIALAEAEGSVRIDIVFDVYKDVSIKNAERQSRSNSVEEIVYKTIFPSQVVQQWDSFKGSSHQNGERKTACAEPNWESTTLLCLSHVMKSVSKIMSNTVELVPELESSQEEANASMMLHLAHVSQYDFSCAVIASIDADVTFLCLTNYHKFPMSLFQKCCSETRMKYVDIASIDNVLLRNVCEALSGIHAITGCDTVSSFAGKGKLSAFQFVKNFLPGLDSPGSSVMQTLPNYRYLLAHCMVPKSLRLMSTLSGTNCSAPNKQTLKDTSFLFVLTACTSTV